MENFEIIKRIRLIAVLSILFLLSLYFIGNSLRAGTLIVKTDKVPFNIQIKNKNYKNVKEFKKRLVPGNYTIKISKNNYLDLERQIKIESKKITKLDLELQFTPRFKKIKEYQQKSNYEQPSPPSFIVTDNQFLHYLDNQDEKFKKMNLNSYQESTISEKVFKNISNIAWSFDFSKIIGLEINPKNYEEVYFIYSFTTNQKRYFNKNVKNILWSIKDDKIAYFKQEKNKSSLYISDYDGKNTKKIKDFNKNESIEINWFDDEKIIYTLNYQEKTYIKGYPILAPRSSIQLFDLNKNAVTALTNTGFSKNALISPDGQKILYLEENLNKNEGENQEEQSTEALKYNLSLMNIDGGLKVNLNLPTFFGRFIWISNQKVLIARVTPESDPDLDLTIDDFWIINLNDVSNPIKLSQEKFEGTFNLIYANKKVYFTTNKALYEMQVEE